MCPLNSVHELSLQGLLTGEEEQALKPMPLFLWPRAALWELASEGLWEPLMGEPLGSSSG